MSATDATAASPDGLTAALDESTGLDPRRWRALPVILIGSFLSFLDFWRDLPREDRAIFAKSVKPDLTDEEVARLSGVNPRTLYRWARYQSFKPRLADFRAAEQLRWN